MMISYIIRKCTRALHPLSLGAMGACMGAPVSEPRLTEEEEAESPPKLAGKRLRIRIRQANRVPSTDICVHARSYVSVAFEGSKLAGAQSKVCTGRAPSWDETLTLRCDLADAYARNISIRFTLWHAHLLRPDRFIGTAVIPIRSLVRRPSIPLLLCSHDGNPVNCGSPPVPVELTVSVASNKRSLWPAPCESEEKEYPRHVMIFSRGTRGDVQPFIALAIGMAEKQGWLVTIVTELRFHDWIKAQTANVSAGKVRFLPSGGDTQKNMSIWLAQHVFLQAKTELAQWMMLGASESNFFSSVPTFVHQMRKCQVKQSEVYPSTNEDGHSVALQWRFYQQLCCIGLPVALPRSSSKGFAKALPVAS